MSPLTLVVGNKNYSSWSLRPWLALRMAGLDFAEERIPLYGPGSRDAILRHSPAGRVPILHDGDLTVWDSLAICEYAAELAPRAGLWPDDRAARAHARSISAEMHAGFAALRNALPMNLRLDGAQLATPPSPEVEADIARILAIFEECRARHEDAWRVPLRSLHDRGRDVRAGRDAAAFVLGAAAGARAGVRRCDQVAGADAGMGGGGRRGGRALAGVRGARSTVAGLTGPTAATKLPGRCVAWPSLPFCSSS